MRYCYFIDLKSCLRFRIYGLIFAENLSILSYETIRYNYTFCEYFVFKYLVINIKVK